jgi:1-phosphatidylinositol phosphodiesterase
MRAMATERTTLCIVNTSGLNITDITVTGVNAGDWDGQNQPDRNFQGASIAPNDSRCEPEEVDKRADAATYAMTLTFSNGTALSFTNDQRDAFTKHDRDYPATGSATATLRLSQTSGGGSNAMNVQTVAVPDNSGWMAALLAKDGTLTVDRITMPGSHDAGMYTIESTTTLSQPEWAQTQSLSILDQLKAGSRYFDLRVYYDGEAYRTGHFSGGQGSFGPLLTDILYQVATFLTASGGTGEAVFLKFSHTSSGYNSKLSTSDMTKTVVRMVQDGLGSLLYSGDSTTNLAMLPLTTLQGKACAVFDYEYEGWIDPSAGIFRYTDMAEDGTVKVSAGLTVYDNYSGTSTLDEMMADQNAKLARFGGYGKPYLFLLSWTLTGDAGLADVEVLAGIANPWLPQYTTQYTSGPIKPNIVYIDFVNPYLCSCIIGING